MAFSRSSVKFLIFWKSDSRMPARGFDVLAILSEISLIFVFASSIFSFVLAISSESSSKCDFKLIMPERLMFEKSMFSMSSFIFFNVSTIFFIFSIFACIFLTFFIISLSSFAISAMVLINFIAG